MSNTQDIKNKVDKVKKFKPGKHIQLGLIVYLLIFAYLVFVFISFSFSKKTNYTVAEPGKIVEAVELKGVIIRDENIIQSKMDGKVSHFSVEGEKVKQGSLIAVVDQNGEITNSILSELQADQTNQLVDVKLTDKNLQYMKQLMKNYVLNKSTKEFNYTYATKEHLKNTYFDMAQTSAMDTMGVVNSLVNSEQLASQTNASLDNFYFSPQNGVISFKLDGYEDFSIEDIGTKRMNDLLEVENHEIKTNDSVEIDQPIYKIVQNYQWFIVAEIDNVCRKYIEDQKNIRILVKNSDVDIIAKKEQIIEMDTKIYLVLSVDRYLNYFLNERVVDFSIEYYNWEGIKIPTAAVTQKEFAVIPAQALIDRGKYYDVMKKELDEEAALEESIVPIRISICSIDGDLAYIPISENLGIGTQIVYGTDGKMNTNYEISSTKKLDGVYVINKGYADFKLIKAVASNEKYLIIEENTYYGIYCYDKIVSDATQVVENEIID